MKGFFKAMFANLFTPRAPTGTAFIQVEEAKSIIDSNKADLILDVRSDEEYKMGHIPGAYHAPITSFGAYVDDLMKHKNKTVLVYCRTQVRSSSVANHLAKLGFTNLKVVYGGIVKWVGAGFTTEK